MKHLFLITFIFYSNFATSFESYLEPSLGFAPALSRVRIATTEDSEGEKEYAKWEHKMTLYWDIKYGVKFSDFLLGLSYSRGTPNFKSSENTGSAPIDITGKYVQSTFGLYFGYVFLENYRAWYSYYLSSSIESTQGTTLGDKIKGDGFSFNFSYKVYENLFTNLSYRIHHWDLYQDESEKEEFSTGGKYSGREVILSISYFFKL